MQLGAEQIWAEIRNWLAETAKDLEHFENGNMSHRPTARTLIIPQDAIKGYGVGEAGYDDPRKGPIWDLEPLWLNGGTARRVCTRV